MEVVLASLLNDLGALDNDVVLVLDDYSVIDAREVHEVAGRWVSLREWTT